MTRELATYRNRLPVGACVRLPAGLLAEVIRARDQPRGMTAIRLTVGPVSADLLVPRSRLEYVARWYRNGVAWEEREIEVERKALVAQR